MFHNASLNSHILYMYVLRSMQNDLNIFSAASLRLSVQLYAFNHHHHISSVYVFHFSVLYVLIMSIYLQYIGFGV